MEESSDGAMKTLVAVLLLSAIIGCESTKQQQDRIDAAQKQFNQTIQDSQSDLDRKLRDAEIKLFSQQYGEQAGIDLLFCEHNPPQLEKNKAKCQRLEVRFEKFRSYRKTHPTW
jgi:hypothetical protein